MTHNDVNVGEKKIMNNNPTVAGVNFVHDIVGKGGEKSAGFKIVISVLVFLLAAVGVFMLIFAKFVSGIFFLSIAAVLVISTLGLKSKSKKYKVDKKVMDEIEPLFKD